MMRQGFKDNALKSMEKRKQKESISKYLATLGINFAKIRTILLINPSIVDTEHFLDKMNYFSQPVGLLRIASFLKDKGKDVALLDCMEKTSVKIKSENLSEWIEHKEVEEAQTKDRVAPLLLIGKDYEEIEKRLKSYRKIDLILVTSGMTFHYRPVHKVIDICKKVMPRVPVMVGGIYATLCFEHAKKSKADIVWRGDFFDASSYRSDLSLYKESPDYAVIKFTKGCSNRCSYCAVHILEGDRFKISRPIEDVVEEMKHKKEQYGIKEFVFYESNVLARPFYFEHLLDKIIESNLDTPIYFPEGFMSNFLSAKLIRRMRRAGVYKFMISLEASSNQRIKELNRTISLEDHDKAVERLKKEYSVNDRSGINDIIYVNLLVNLPNQKISDIIGGILWCWRRKVNYVPMFFSPVPGTEEYRKCGLTPESRDLQDLHSHLFINEKNELSRRDLEVIYSLRHSAWPSGMSKERLRDFLFQKFCPGREAIIEKPVTKRADVKIGFLCNNRCRHCVQGDKRQQYGNKTLRQIRGELRNAISDGCTEVVFTGGEPTLHKDFLELVRCSKDLGFKSIQIQTNGRMFSYMDFCIRTIKAGANDFCLAVHGHTDSVHDYLTSVKGSFGQTIQGMRNLKSLNVRVASNIVVSKVNYRHLPQIAKLLVVLGVDQFQFAFPHPTGKAGENLPTIVPRMKEIIPYVKRGLEVGIKAGKRVMTEAIPYCLMVGYEDYVGEMSIPDTEVFESDYKIDNYTEYRRNEGKSKGPECQRCKYRSVCEGPWREYPEVFGWDEFRPVLNNYV